MATRIQSKSRPTKRPMWKTQFSTGTGVITSVSIPGRKPRMDKKGYPAYKGLPGPVLVSVDVVA